MQVEVLAWCYYARGLLAFKTRLAFRSVAEKKKIGCCSMSFPVRPGRSPGMMLLCLSASKIYNTFSISILSRKKTLGCCSIYPFCFSQVEVLASCYYAWALLGYITSLYFTISIFSRKKKLGSFSRSFLVHPGRSSGMMLLCLSACRINNTVSILIRSRK